MGAFVGVTRAEADDRMDEVIVLNEDGSRRDVSFLRADIDRLNRTVSIEVRDSSPEALRVLAGEAWLLSAVPHPGFADIPFVRTEHESAWWFDVKIPDPRGGAIIEIKEFRPEVGRAWYTLGSTKSISLERPMFVSLAEVPRVEWRRVEQSNANGTWIQENPVPISRMGIDFTDENTSGQTVTLSRAWLGSYGLTTPYFRHANGTPIANTSDDYYFYLEPEHFSILYVFSYASEGFVKLDDGPYSDVAWDEGNRDIYLLSDRRDPTGTDESLSSGSLLTYDDTTSFTVRATWSTTQQGNWQLAVPVFLMAGWNTQIDMVNSIYVLYASRDSNEGWLPWYHLRFNDWYGIMRVDHVIQNVPVNTELQFLIDYDAYSRRLTLALYEIDGTGVVTLGSTSYVLPPTVEFNVHRVGTAAWGLSSTQEPPTIAQVDNIYFDANTARNGDFEEDSDLDGVPDYWEDWPWAHGPVLRSSVLRRFGNWAVRIDDGSVALQYGLQTVRMAVSPGQTFAGSVWAYALSGWFYLCLEIWDTPSGNGARLGVVCKSTALTNTWEYLDVMLKAPAEAGSYWLDLLLYSSDSNVGEGYFDGAELRLSRSSWAITVHGNNLDPDFEKWNRAFGYVGDLGITYVRQNLMWKTFELTRGSIDWDEVDYWSEIIQMARVRGLGFIPILSHPPLWASDLYDGTAQQKEEFFAAWRSFAQLVAEEYGESVYFYQVLNEENHDWHSDIWHDDEPRAFFEAYQGLLAGEALTPADHKSGFKTIINMWADDLLFGNDWNTHLRDILNDPSGESSIDIVAIDHFPGTWCCGSNYRDWDALDTLLAIAIDYKKEMAVMETGFSTYDDNGHDQGDQEAYVDQAMDEVLAKRNYQTSNYPLNALLLVGWYEFLDLCTGCWAIIRQEPNFGILTYDSATGEWGLKLAFDNLRFQVSRWT